MASSTYLNRREQLTTYFDQTAAKAWRALTSDEPVNRVRQTVRAGRDSMRAALLDRLPADLSGRRLLDAGCGTGALAIEAARRGAHVVAVDVASSLVDVARDRCPDDLGDGRIEFLVGDMCGSDLGQFDHVVAMDSLIHYESPDIVASIGALAERTQQSILFTFAPRTAALAMMHFVGRLIPQRSNRAPAIVPVAHARLTRELAASPKTENWTIADTHLVSAGFYKSQLLELRRT